MEQENKKQDNRTLATGFFELEAKCKELQHASNYVLDKTQYIIVHCDGRSFSKLIKNKFSKPFSEPFANMMDKTTLYLAQHVSGCVYAYNQSDEITLIIAIQNPADTGFFGLRLCKMQSIIASMATACFMNEYHKFRMNEDSDYVPELMVQFDCKCWNVPAYSDVIEWLIYRQQDCVRNSKSMFAQAFCSHSELHKKNVNEMIEYTAKEKGHDWYTEVPDGFKKGRHLWKEMKVAEMNPEVQRLTFMQHTDLFFNDQEQLSAWEELNIIPKILHL